MGLLTENEGNPITSEKVTRVYLSINFPLLTGVDMMKYLGVSQIMACVHLKAVLIFDN